MPQPQQLAEPSGARPHEWLPPADTWLNVKVAPRAAGAVCWVVEPMPSCPAAFEPQACAACCLPQYHLPSAA